MIEPQDEKPQDEGFAREASALPSKIGEGAPDPRSAQLLRCGVPERKRRTHSPNLASAIEHFARILHTMGFRAGLKPPQWALLRYLDRAPFGERTLSHFAAFQAITKGAASQSVAAILRRDLAAATIDPQDRRVRRLELTERGRALLAGDPLQTLETALDAMSEENRFVLYNLIETLGRRLTRESAPMLET